LAETADVATFPLDAADRVAATLRPFVSEERQARIESVLASRTRDPVLVLENIHSDHNTSAVLRTAEAMGVLELHIVAVTTPFVISRRVVKGAHKWLELHGHPSIEEAYAALRARGYRIWASHFAANGVTEIARVPVDRPLALVFGNEHEGLSRASIDQADGWFRVPMKGFVESLNISVATSIALYDVLARRPPRPIGSDDVRRLRAAWYALSVRAAPLLLEREGLPTPLHPRGPLIIDDDSGVDGNSHLL
jgi:tRNA (guanosine-2'-O-)-methyltransferase